MSLVYTWEKLYLAVDALCGQGGQDARLMNAATRGLLQVRPDDLPAELRGEFLRLKRDLTAVRVDGDEANVQATIKTLDASDRERAVRTILILFSAVCRKIASY